jgi:hypothetical protein
MTPEHLANEHYYEALDLAHLVGVPGEHPTDLLMRCANALANLRASLIEHYKAPAKDKLN